MKIKTILSVVFIFSIILGFLWGYRDVEANNLLSVHKQSEHSEAEPICSDSLAFESLAQGDYYSGASLEDFSGSPGEPSTIIASNWAQAEALQPIFPHLNPQLLQSVDYSEYFVFAILLGGRGHGGIEIIIDEVCIHENTISIEAQEFSPTIVTTNLTAPYHIVRVQKESNWNQEMNSVLFLDGQQIFTQNPAIFTFDPLTPIPIVPPSLLPVGTPHTSTPTPIVFGIMAGDYTVEPGGRVDVIIEGTDFEEVGVISVDIVYDPAILQVVSCESLLVDADSKNCNAHFQSDTIRINGTWLEGSNGDVSLAKIVHWLPQ